MAGRTTIIISHDLHTVTDADEIVVLEGGAVSAVGRHEQLLATSPIYAHLYALHQALGRVVAPPPAPPVVPPPAPRPAMTAVPAPVRPARPRGCSPRWWTSRPRRSGWCAARRPGASPAGMASRAPPRRRRVRGPRMPGTRAQLRVVDDRGTAASGRAAVRAAAANAGPPTSAPRRPAAPGAAASTGAPRRAAAPRRRSLPRSQTRRRVRARVVGTASVAATAPLRRRDRSRAEVGSAAPVNAAAVPPPRPRGTATTPLPLPSRAAAMCGLPCRRPSCRDLRRRRRGQPRHLPDRARASRPAPPPPTTPLWAAGSAPVTAPGLAHQLPGPRAARTTAVLTAPRLGSAAWVRTRSVGSGTSSSRTCPTTCGSGSGSSRRSPASCRTCSARWPAARASCGRSSTTTTR